MVEVETNSLDYALADPAEAYKQAFAAFSGAAWVGESQYRQSDEVLVAAKALNEQFGLNEAVITEEDTKALASEVTQVCMAAGVSPAEIAVLVARIEGSVGGSKATLDGIRSAVMSEATSLASAAAGKAAESAEARRERLWAEIREKQKTVDEQMHEAHARGDISDAQLNEYLRNKATEESLSNRPDNDPERIAATRTTAVGATAALEGAARKAVAEGRTEDAESARGGAKEAGDIVTATEIIGRTERQENARVVPPVRDEELANPVVAQAQAALSPTVIASYRGSGEVVPPLETPADAAAATPARTSTRNL